MVPLLHRLKLHRQQNTSYQSIWDKPNVTVKEDGTVNEFVFRTSFIDPFQGTVAANFAANELNVKT